MDFSKLTGSQLNEFLELHQIMPYPNVKDRAVQAERLYTEQPKKITLPVRDLEIATNFLASGQNLANSYTENELRSLSPDDKTQLALLFQLNQQDPNFTDRLIRIVKYIGKIKPTKIVLPQIIIPSIPKSSSTPKQPIIPSTPKQPIIPSTPKQPIIPKPSIIPSIPKPLSIPQQPTISKPLIIPSIPQRPNIPKPLIIPSIPHKPIIPKTTPSTPKTIPNTPKTTPSTPKTTPSTPKTIPNTPKTIPNTPKTIPKIIPSISPTSSSMASKNLMPPIEPLWTWLVEENEAPIPIKYPVYDKYKIKNIENWRSWIGMRSGAPVFGMITVEDLKTLYALYNEYFFNNSLSLTTSLEVSDRLTKTAGLCKRCTGTSCSCRYKIIISNPVFSKISLVEGQSTQSGGLECKTPLECLQLTLEHEMIHLAIQETYHSKRYLDQKIYSAHGALFKDLVNAYFGQTKSTHNIGKIILSDEEGSPLARSDAIIGRIVSYISNDELYKGVITRPSKSHVNIKLLTGEYAGSGYDFLNNIDPEDEDIEVLTALSEEIIAKVNYYHTIRIGQTVQIVINDQIKNVVVTNLRPRSYKFDANTYTYLYIVLVVPTINSQTIKSPTIKSPVSPTIISKEINKNTLKLGDTVLFGNQKYRSEGIIIKKNPTKAIVYDIDKKILNVSYGLITEILPMNKNLANEIAVKKALMETLVPGQQVTYTYSTREGSGTYTGTLSKKKSAENLVVTFKGGIMANIHYLNLVA